MTIFYICAAALVAICLLWLLIGLFKGKQFSTDQEAVNITLARERRTTLDAALADGSIDQASYDYELNQLKQDLAGDLTLGEKKQRDGRWAAAILVALFVPFSAGALYMKLGNPGAVTQITTAVASQPEQAPLPGEAPALTELLPQLEAKLSESPDDVNGWRLLGRSYLSVDAFAEAQSAFEKAVALEENDVPTITQLAESIAMGKQGDLSGKPIELLARANTIDPDHEQTLWLLAIAKQQTGDHEAALADFDHLAELAKANPEAQVAIDDMRNRSVQALGGEVIERPSPSEKASPSETPDQTPATGGSAIKVSVSLDDSALANVKPDDSVFVYAKASKGPPMPLAVSRLTVKDLPATISLDDSMAMIPNMKLSSFEDVIVGARVSPSGNPIAQSGDWFSESSSIKLADTPELSLQIDTQTP